MLQTCRHHLEGAKKKHLKCTFGRLAHFFPSPPFSLTQLGAALWRRYGNLTHKDISTSILNIQPERAKNQAKFPSCCSCVCSPDSEVCCHLCIVLYYVSHVFMLFGGLARLDGMRSWGPRLCSCSPMLVADCTIKHKFILATERKKKSSAICFAFDTVLRFIV